MNFTWTFRLWPSPNDEVCPHSVLVFQHTASIVIAIICLSVSLPKPMGQVMKATRKARIMGSDILLPHLHHAIQELFVRAKNRRSD